MSVITIGVLGCAGIAQRSFIPAIGKLPKHFRLAGVASRSVEKGEEFARHFGCRVYRSYDRLIEDETIAALYLPLPTGLHEEWVNRALAAGKHVYAEKSLASTHAQAQQMVATARARSLVLMEGYMFQYHRQHRHLKELVGSGDIGEPRHFSAAFGFPPLDSSNFRYDRAIGGGALLDTAGYTVRAAFHVLERELEVKGATLHYDANGTSIHGSAFLSAGDGLGASLAFGFDNAYQCYYQLWGSKGRITANKAFTLPPDQVPTFTLERDNRSEIIESFADDHFVAALRVFRRAIHDDSERERLYDEALIQSRALGDIETLAR